MHSKIEKVAIAMMILTILNLTTLSVIMNWSEPGHGFIGLFIEAFKMIAAHI